MINKIKLPNKKALGRFIKYSSIGISTFIIDLALLFLFIDLFKWHYIFSTALAFIFAVTLNYFISRKIVFNKSQRKIGSGYIIFIIIAILGMLFITSGMIFFVEILKFNYLLSRILIAGIVGIWNYLINLYFNFKVAGKF